MKPEIGAIYEHYKKKTQYKIIGFGKHSETLEELVIYQPLYKSEIEYWLRPISMFLEEVEFEGKKVPRFSKVS